MPGVSFVLIGVGAALVVITSISLIIASLGRLNTDQSWYFFDINWEWRFFLQVAISYNTISKKLGRNTQAAGLHLNAPGFHFIIFPSVFTSMEFDDISVRFFSRRLIGIDLLNLVPQSRRCFDQSRCHFTISSGSEALIWYSFAIQRFWGV